jgi:hypothetical protein
VQETSKVSADHAPVSPPFQIWVQSHAAKTWNQWNYVWRSLLARFSSHFVLGYLSLVARHSKAYGGSLPISFFFSWSLFKRLIGSRHRCDSDSHRKNHRALKHCAVCGDNNSCYRSFRRLVIQLVFCKLAGLMAMDRFSASSS